MADSGTPKCGSCSEPVAGAPDSATPETCPDTTVPATDPCTTSVECDTPISACEEDHTNTVIEKSFRATVKVTNTFNFPAVGEFASLTLDSVESILPGAILWNRTVGRLYVESFDSTTMVAVVTNKGDSCDATAKTAGDSVPACTEFTVGIPECNVGLGGGNSDTVPYLAADFVAPADTECQLASVTNVNGINVNDIVSVNTFLYRVQSVPDANTLELCNEGQGAPTGQVIEWDPNCDDIPDVQVVSVSSDDPCSRDAVNSGIIIVCDDGVRKPLEGTADSQIPIWDEAQGKFILQTVSLPESCTHLTVCLTVDIGDDGPYLATVENTALFLVGNTVIIDDDAFTIDAIVDGTHLRLIPVVTPPAIKEYMVGETVCIQDCCVTLPGRVEEIENTLADPCFNLGLFNTSYFTFATQDLNFQPTDLGGGNYQQYYDIGDPALQPPFFSHTVDVPATGGCNYFIEAQAFMTIGANVGASPDAAMQLLRQTHDFVLALNGDTSSREPRGIASFKGTVPAEDFANNAPPAGFYPLPYQYLGPYVNFSMYREIDVVGGVDPDPVFDIGHRLMFSDNVSAPNWGNAANMVQWAITGSVIVKMYRPIA